MDKQEVKRLESKIDLLIRLFAAQCVGEKGKNEAIRTLGRLGMERNEIAAVCDTTVNTVSVRLSEAKKAAKKKERSNE